MNGNHFTPSFLFTLTPRDFLAMSSMYWRLNQKMVPAEGINYVIKTMGTARWDFESCLNIF